MNIDRKKCIICQKFNEVIHTEHAVPISFTVVDKNTDYIYSNLIYGYCKNCNIIQLNNLIDLNILYSSPHNYQVVGNTWKEYFSNFIEILNPYVIDKNVLEIGCPSGKIASNCNTYKSWNIVDPNVKNFNNKKMVAIPKFFDYNFSIDISIDIIIHSHLFEHIYYPNEFLQNCYKILKNDGVMIFGMPNMEYIMNENLSLYLGVIFEHNIFYTTSNVIKILEENNFKILDVSFYKNHSIFFKVKKKCVNDCKYIVKDNQSSIDNLNLKEKFIENINYYNKCIDKWSGYINNNYNNKEIYLFGASYNNNLLLHKIQNKINIIGILDNCFEKQNKYFYGYNLKVLSPDILKNKNVIVLLKNGVYVEEIKKQILEINNNTIILT